MHVMQREGKGDGRGALSKTGGRARNREREAWGQ